MVNYERGYTTKIGTLTLRVPRTKDGKLSTEIFWKISKKWESSTCNHVRNVCSRSINKKSIQCNRKKYVPYSKSFVSSLTKDLDEEVKLWRNSDISTIKYPYVIVYVVYIKVRKNNKVISKACYIAIGINEKRKQRNHRLRSKW